MTSHAPPTGTAPERAVPLVSVALLACGGAWAAAFVRGFAPPPPAGSGSARLASPEILLAVFDTVWLLLLLPGRTLLRRVVLLAAGLPFHVALAAAAAAGPGHAGAFALLALGFAAVAAVSCGQESRRPGLALSLVTFALPLAAYVLLEFVGLGDQVLLLASPLTAPTLLARDAASVGATAGLPGIAGAAAALVLERILERP